MTPVDELAAMKLRTRNFDFTEKELEFLIKLADTHIERIYKNQPRYF